MQAPTVKATALFHITMLILVGGAVLSAAEEQPSSSEPVNTVPIMLDAVSVKAARERVDRYQAKADDLFDGLRAEKKIRYATVIEGSYDTSKFDLVETLLAKKKYRETVAKGHTFFCNYAAVNLDVPVFFEMVDELRGVSVNGGGVGGSMYLFKKKKIQLRLGGDKTKIFHAAGAALSGFIAPENLPVIKDIGKKKKDAEFVKEVNFEVRLQDLNRYYAVMTDGRPIMTPIDAVRAIVGMGESLKKPMVQEILTRNHIDYIPAELDKALANAVYKKDGGDTGENGIATTFTVARRLVGGMLSTDSADANGGGSSAVLVEPGLELLSGKEYEDYLERILIEAPGHI
jgi:hypothetical protein